MQVDLFDRADDTPRPAWQVIEAARRRYLTGQLVLGTTPATHVYLRDGQVYFAERATDGGLAVRLLVEGVLTREQMHRATLQVSGVEHLGRMFDRDDTIDRDAVELCVELLTDDVLTGIADVEITGFQLHMYRRHPSGLDRWLPTRVEVITHVMSQPGLADEGAAVESGPAPRPRAHLTPPPVTGEVAVVTPQHSAVEPVHVEPVHVEPVHVEPVHVGPAADAASPTAVAPAAEPTSQEVEPHVTGEVPAQAVVAPFRPAELPTTENPTVELFAVRPVSSAPDVQPVYVTGETPAIPPISVVPPPTLTTLQLAALDAITPAPATIEQPAVAITMPVSDVPQLDAFVAGNIADEVAEAVRRALAAIDVP